MNKNYPHTIVLSLSVFLVIILIFGCSFNTDDGDDPITPLPIKYNLTVNTYDKDTKQALTGTQISIFESSTNQLLSSNNCNFTLERGPYNIYISKEGYRTEGYFFDLQDDTIVNAYIKNYEYPSYQHQTISGVVQEHNGPYSEAFSVVAGTVNSTTSMKTANETKSGSFSISSTCGNIVLSAFTTLNNRIDKITYLANLALEFENPISDITLNLPETGSRYYGSKPSNSSLFVKLNDDYRLALQQSPTSDFSFNVDVQKQDKITLEINRLDGDNSYFSRIDAGNKGGEYALSYMLDLPDITFTDKGDYVLLSFDSVPGASCYEAYVTEIRLAGFRHPYHATILSGNSVKIPKSVWGITTTTTKIKVFLKAVNIKNFNIKDVLLGTQSFAQYSYSETGQDITEMKDIGSLNAF